MTYERLVQQRRIRSYQAKPEEVARLLEIATRDLATADRLLAEDPDWAFNIVYNALLQAARALVLHEGFRSRGAGQHWTVVEFCREALGPEHKQQVALFDQMRRKRHRLVYEMAGLVSRQEVEQAVAFARVFVDEMRRRITGQSRLEIEEE